jgi:nucleoside-diphosphate-sugar epimerase
MKILVTGGVGYIGSQTTLALQEAGHEVVIFDRRIGSPRAILAKGTTAVTGDLLDPSALQALFGAHQFDAVVHFAALIQAGESVAKPLEFYENNTMGTLNLLQAMQTANVSRIVFSSTAAVYGDADQIPTTETDGLRIAEELATRWPGVRYDISQRAIIFQQDSFEKFAHDIAPHVPEMMCSKLPEKYRCFAKASPLRKVDSSAGEV